MSTNPVRVLAALAALGLSACAPLARSSRAQDPPAKEATRDDQGLVAALIEAHNRERAQEKRPPLKLNAKLEAAARVHARDMAKHQKMTHTGSDGSTSAQRVERQGYHYQDVGENVAYGQKTVAEVMDTWMNSQGHKKNILDPAFTEIGAARAFDEEGTPYWCVDFGRPIPQLDPGDAAGALVAALNKARADAGKPPMSVDPKLAEIARRHAREMAEKDKLDTKDSDGLSPLERIQKQRLRYQAFGQSDASGQPTAADVLKSWLDSKVHKDNLLGPYSRIGVGYATAKGGTPYWSVIFARPFGR
jgi:uncharacterized protein YkwD